MQIPILNGIYTDNSPALRTSYPVNMVPVPKDNGISAGFLRPADGIIQNGTGPGIDRGGINWNGVCYRVMGSKLVTVSTNGTVTILGDVGNDDRLVTLDYSFDLLGIASNGNLFFWDPAAGTLKQNIDPDLGIVLDMVWVDGYWMTTDGEFLTVTELNNPLAVNPLKYGSSEIDPDPIVGLIKFRNEIYALNRNTIEVFHNVGSELFPFERIAGAQIQAGSVGTMACCQFADAVAFLGGGRNEQPSVYIGVNANASKISTQEIDQILMNYTEDQLSLAQFEVRNDQGHEHLYIHLPDRTLVFDSEASRYLKQPVWFILTSSVEGFSEYRARNMVWCFDKWLVGDPSSAAIGYLDVDISSHWGEIVRWEFGTTIVYNEGKGAIFSELELVGLTGRVPIGENPTISTSYSVDGETWSQSKFIGAGKQGQRQKRLVWFQQGWMRNWRIQRFEGTSEAQVAFARLEARLEPLAF